MPNQPRLASDTESRKLGGGIVNSASASLIPSLSRLATSAAPTPLLHSLMPAPLSLHAASRTQNADGIRKRCQSRETFLAPRWGLSLIWASRRGSRAPSLEAVELFRPLFRRSRGYRLHPAAEARSLPAGADPPIQNLGRLGGRCHRERKLTQITALARAMFHLGGQCGGDRAAQVPAFRCPRGEPLRLGIDGTMSGGSKTRPSASSVASRASRSAGTVPPPPISRAVAGELDSALLVGEAAGTLDCWQLFRERYVSSAPKAIRSPGSAIQSRPWRRKPRHRGAGSPRPRPGARAALCRRRG